jgi:hypothetical protein
MLSVMADSMTDTPILSPAAKAARAIAHDNSENNSLIASPPHENRKFSLSDET